MLRPTCFLILLAAWSATAAEDVFLKALRWRSIGPYRGGRVTAVSGVNTQRDVYYFGATGGGVWKTVDGGQSWTPISDGFFKTGSVGAIAVSDSDPNILYVGMGESPVRGNVSHGDGVYKSVDAGKTWKHVGLGDTRHIGRIRIHPRNPDLVYVAAMGHLFGPGDERGVFRSKDGGKTWQKVLSRSNVAGAFELILDPSNADVLYATTWEVKRGPYFLESGGPGSGIFQSTDGGDTWTDISRRPGLPKGVLGKIGFAVSKPNPDRLWAMVEAEDGGLFRSDDAGKTWRRVNENRNLRQRAWYYSRVYADTQNADRVYVLNVGFHRSDDGGRTFTTLPTPHGDNHDLWIDPADHLRMVQSNDGGANVTYNGGRVWTDQHHPTAQFYRVALDQDFPYNVYGAQQDNTTVRIASRTTESGIDTRHWWPVGGGESGWIAPHPKDSNIVFAGSYGGYLTRYDHRTGQSRAINVWPENPMGHGAEGMKYRFQWNFPILFSPHDPNVLYTAGDRVFRSTNEGQSWQAISPDLTRNDKSKQGPTGGPITKDNTSVEYYCTIFTMAESPVTKGVIWTGSDDGLVQVTRDGGKTWTNVTPPRDLMPEWIQINSLEASPHDAATAYVAATMYKSDDFQPYLYQTSDYGKTWKKIVNGIPPNAFTRVIREDPARRGLLYAGTETGLYVSFNDGAKWMPLQMNLPIVPITDLAVQAREKDLVVATQGRSFWILDDLPVLHQIKDGLDQQAAHLFTPEDAYRMPGSRRFGRGPTTAGDNPSPGVTVYYWLKDKPTGEATLEFLDAAGKLVRKFSSKAPNAAPAAAAASDSEEGGPPAGPSSIPAEAGLNRFTWNLRYPDAARFPGLILWAGNTTGPQASPGRYTARLTANGQTQSVTFELKKDPRVSTTPEEFSKQLSLLLQIRDKLTETHEAIAQIRDTRKQLLDTAARYRDLPEGKAIDDAAQALNRKLTVVEEELYQTKNQSGQDPLNYPIRLNNKLAALASIVASADTAPTDQSYQLHEELASKINAQLRALGDAMGADLSAFNRLVREKNVPAVLIKGKK